MEKEIYEAKKVTENKERIFKTKDIIFTGIIAFLVGAIITASGFLIFNKPHKRDDIKNFRQDEIQRNLEQGKGQKDINRNDGMKDNQRPKERPNINQNNQSESNTQNNNQNNNQTAPNTPNIPNNSNSEKKS